MFNSLKTRFIVSFILVQAIFLTLITALNFSSLNKASQTLTQEKIQASSELFAELIKVPLSVYDLATIDDAVNNFSKIKNVVAVEVSDAQNNTVSEFIEKGIFPTATFHKLKKTDTLYEYHNNLFSFYTVNVTLENEHIGDAHFVYNMTGTAKSINDNRNYSYLLIITSLSIGLLIAFIIGNGLENSLKKLVNIAQAVSNDKPVTIPFDPKKNDDMGKLFTAMHTMQEHITQRTKSLRASLREFEQFFHALESSAIVSKTDVHGNITYVNDKFIQISGYSREELLGQNHKLIRHPDMDTNVFHELWKTILSKHTFHATLKNRKKNTEAYFVDTTIIPLLDDDDNITEFLAISYDVTEIIEARNKALSAEKAKSEFLSNMSHEIRTPMNAVLGFIQILQKAETDPKKLSYLNLIQDSSQTLLQVINEILDFSKLESGKLHIDYHPFNPLIEFSQASKFFMINANEKSIDFLCYIDPNIPQCLSSDLIRIKQILFNFLSNAFKFTPEHKAIRIDITYKDESLSISVKDEGIGLDPATLNKIFNAFEQADNSTTRKYGGTGLGLSISKKLAELMNGNILVDSVEGVGSTFTLCLPAALCEINSDKSIYLNQSLKEKTIGLLYTENNDTDALELIKRYLIELGVRQINPITEIEGFHDDIIIFTPEERVNKVVIDSRKPALALMKSEGSLFDDQNQLSKITIPYTPFDLIMALNTLLQENQIQDLKEKTPQAKNYHGHILIVEDNLTNQLLIKLLLDDFNLQYTVANDGLEAVNAFMDSNFDLVLMDENMPNMTGVEAVKKIREYEMENQKALTPIVALTANVMKEERQRFKEAGMNDFLAKPINTQELERVLEHFLLS